MGFFAWLKNFFASFHRTTPTPPPPLSPSPSPTSPPPVIPVVPVLDSLVQVIAFIIGEPNLAISERTKQLRTLISDEFGLGAQGEYLNCTEYVQYRVARAGVKIVWPPDRPRNGGHWGDIFSRHGLYAVLDAPLAGCAMSFTTGISSNPEINAVGHVAYVEEVRSDGGIRVSEANWPNQGKYNERVLAPAEWRDKYKAKFIRFS